MSLMPLIHDKQVLLLYLTARKSSEGSMIDDTQREAIRFLGKLARNHNADAIAALEQLRRIPSCHPLLREMIYAELGIPA